VATHVTLRSPSTLLSPPHKSRAGAARGREEKIFKHLTVHVLPAVIQPYSTPTTYKQTIEQLRKENKLPVPEVEGMPAGAPVAGITSTAPQAGGYGGDLMSQVRRYAALAVELANRESFDVIHAHDWMTYPAGLAVAAYSGKPLVVHVHSTEFDRSGENVWQPVYEIERAGMHGADKVICVSYLTRRIVLNRYNVPPEKVEVVYNAVENNGHSEWDITPIARDEKIVLFLGRITLQKGPEYFIQAAKKVLDRYKKVRFVVAGSGDMIGRIIEMAANLGIGRFVTFTGFLRGDDVARIFRMADVYVMPSVSEPFGIAPLEALSHNVPTIISKQSGCSEVLRHVLKVDFWDTDEMANKILAVLRHPPLQRVLRQQAKFDLRKLSWRDSAEKCKRIYESVVGG